MPASFETMSYSQLADYFKRTGRTSKKIGNNTYAYPTYRGHDLPSVTIELHGNIIARLTPGAYYLTNAGWGTPTTRNRLDGIARANGIPVRFSQKNYKQIASVVTLGEWIESEYSGGYYERIHTPIEGFTYAVRYDKDNGAVEIVSNMTVRELF